MTFEKYLTQLVDLLEQHPELLHSTVVYAMDNEGNRFIPVSYDPSLGHYNDNEFISTENCNEDPDCENQEPNSICIN